MNETADVEKMVSRIEGCITELFKKAGDDSWEKWSRYVPKAIEQLGRDTGKLNTFRENMSVDLAEVKLSVRKIETSLAELLLEVKAESKALDEYKEKTIVPLKNKVTVLSITSGLIGGAAALIIPTLLKYFLGR